MKRFPGCVRRIYLLYLLYPYLLSCEFIFNILLHFGIWKTRARLLILILCGISNPLPLSHSLARVMNHCCIDVTAIELFKVDPDPRRLLPSE